MAKLCVDQRFLPQLRDVSIDDLLRRKPIKLDQAVLSAFIRDKVVLVTGAAGSIGSELCRQMLHFQPARLIALDCAETPLHDIMLELGKGMGAGRVCSELADVTDPARLRSVFARHVPQVVFHAAALKHVPICESNAREAIRVNVGGTRNVGEAAMRAGTETFILISTDKAVNPSSVMGATKRVAELVVQELNERSLKTRFAAVRFGNVLGSNGSVLGIFKSQIYFDRARFRDRYNFLKSEDLDLLCLTATDIDGQVLWQYGKPHADGRPYCSHAAERMVCCHDVDGDGIR